MSACATEATEQGPPASDGRQFFLLIKVLIGALELE